MVEYSFNGLISDKNPMEGITILCDMKSIEEETGTVEDAGKLAVHLSYDDAKAVLNHLQRVLTETV